MPKTEWQPEPWVVERDTYGEYVYIRTNHKCNLLIPDPSIHQTDAERIVACVNACAGVPTEHLEGGCMEWVMNDRAKAMTMMTPEELKAHIQPQIDSIKAFVKQFEEIPNAD